MDHTFPVEGGIPGSGAGQVEDKAGGTVQSTFQAAPFHESGNQIDAAVSAATLAAVNILLPAAEIAIAHLVANASVLVNSTLTSLPHVADETVSPLVTKVRKEAHALIWGLLDDLLRPVLYILIVAQVCSTLITIMLLECGGKVMACLRRRKNRHDDNTLAMLPGDVRVSRGCRENGIEPCQLPDRRGENWASASLLEVARACESSPEESMKMYVATPACTVQATALGVAQGFWSQPFENKVSAGVIETPHRTGDNTRDKKPRNEARAQKQKNAETQTREKKHVNIPDTKPDNATEKTDRQS